MPFYSKTERSSYILSGLSSDSLTKFKYKALEPLLYAFSFYSKPYPIYVNLYQQQDVS